MAAATLDDTARRVARARWLELRCFEVLGGWVPTTPEPEAKLVFARQSHHHAWHAELFERVLPVASGFTPEDGDPGERWHRVLAELGGLAVTGQRLVAAYDVLLPAKLAEYEHWLDAADPVREAPLRRWLGFVVADERADLAEGRDLIGGRSDDRTPDRSTLERVEALVVAAGPLLHPRPAG